MIDTQAVALVKEAQAKLAKMKDARPSELMAVKEKLGEALLAILTKAAEGITDAHKIKLFDELLEGEVERLAAEIKERMADTYCEDGHSDHAHYVWESVVTSTLGPKIYDASIRWKNCFQQGDKPMKIVTIRLRHGDSQPIKAKGVPDEIAEVLEKSFLSGSNNRFRLTAEGGERTQMLSMADVVLLEIEDDPESENWDN